jgi:glutamate carboxypeptidase
MEQQNKQIQEAVESFRQDMLDFWKDLINFQAGSKEKERMETLMEKVSAYLQKLGLESELVETGAVPLIRAWSGKERAGQPILLSGHLDTVFPNGSYPENPFTIKEGKAYGPGVCDMKGGIVMAVYLAKVLEKIGYDRHPIKLLFVPDEEITHQGSRASCWRKKPRAACAPSTWKPAGWTTASP